MLKKASGTLAIVGVVVSQLGFGVVSASAEGGQEHEVLEAEAPAPEVTSDVPQERMNGKIQTRSAEGLTWAPGGVAASNRIFVKGGGVHVEKASVSYIPGTEIASGNACVDGFEIVYRENGRSGSDSFGPKCSPARVSHTFEIHRNMDPGSKFCGRVKTSDGPGNWACVTIKA